MIGSSNDGLGCKMVLGANVVLGQDSLKRKVVLGAAKSLLKVS